MKKHFQNEVAKREFFAYLKEAKGLSESSINSYESSILLWQKSSNNDDFSKFSKQSAKNFKRWLKTCHKKKNGDNLSLATIYHKLRLLKEFFIWLSQQPGYKSKINATAISYLSLSKKDKRIALQAEKPSFPKMEQVIKVIENIEVNSERDRRDKALISFVLLTGARISAVRSLPLRAFDEETCTIYQNPKFKVQTKYANCITTRFVGIPYYKKALSYFLDWYHYLKNEKQYGPNDPLFPKTITKNGDINIGYHNTGEVEAIFWNSSDPIRRIFKRRFLDADIAYHHPHTLRHLLVATIAKERLSEEQKKALSQNFGHKNIGTTFGSYGYGHIEADRQVDIVGKIKIGDDTAEKKFQLTQKELLKIIQEVQKKKDNNGDQE